MKSFYPIVRTTAVVITAIIVAAVPSAASMAQSAPKTPMAIVTDGATSVQLQTLKNGTIVNQNAGVQDANGMPIANQSYVRAGSTTKTLIATVMMQLVDEGKVNLDSPISTYIPGKLSSGTSITVRDVLSHRSGLSNAYLTSIPLNNPASYPTTTSQLNKMFEAGFNTDQLLDYINAQPLVSTPGTTFSYANANYVVAGAIIQAVTGQSYQQAIRERIFSPLGMMHSFMPGTDATMPTGSAHAYIDVSGIISGGTTQYDVGRYNPSQANAAGELITTTGDLNLFTKSLVSGKLMSAQSFAQMTNASDTGEGYLYGLGLIKLDTKCGVVYGHNGAIYGYASEMYTTADGSRQVALSAAEGPTLPYTTLSGMTAQIAINALCA